MKVSPAMVTHLLFYLLITVWGGSLLLWFRDALRQAILGGCLVLALLTLYLIIQGNRCMFKRKHTPAGQPAGTPSLRAAPADGLPEGGEHSTVAAGVHIRGDISATGIFCVCGRVTGNISVPEGTVRVIHGGRVEGDVSCLTLEVHGEVKGGCITGHAEIGTTGLVAGGLHYGSLTVHPGGGLCGDIRQQELPAPAPLNMNAGRCVPAAGAGNEDVMAGAVPPAAQPASD
ncbi:polymer-forming cytoskeletal protein [Citrobacter freundii]|nr:polymer-forming cytoskeletal protein [Citrobacter freundii]MBC6506691.1 polymer-forming cytoskeletal protein [Citrobacter freundii]